MEDYYCDRCAPTNLPAEAVVSDEVLSSLTQFEQAGFKRVLLQSIRYNEDGVDKLDWYFIFFNANLGILGTMETYWCGTGINATRLYYNWALPAAVKDAVVVNGGVVTHTRSDAGFYWNQDGAPHQLPAELVDSEPVWGELCSAVYQAELAAWQKKLQDYLAAHREVLKVYAAEYRGVFKWHLKRMQEDGVFLSRWLSAPDSLWLLNFNEIKHGEFDFERNERINAEKIRRLPADVQEAINYGNTLVPKLREAVKAVAACLA